MIVCVKAVITAQKYLKGSKVFLGAEGCYFIILLTVKPFLVPFFQSL